MATSTQKAVKAVNYTDAQTADLLKKFASGETVANLAVAFNKSTRSIIAKLSREGVYKAKEKTTKTGEPIATKLEIAEKICDFANLPFDRAESLAKTDKQTLLGIVAEFNLLNSKLAEFEKAE